MTGEPTTWELQRGLDRISGNARLAADSINSRFDRYVTMERHNGEIRRIEERLTGLQSDLNAERESRAADRKEWELRLDKQSSNIRWITATIVLPVALFIASLVLR